MEVEPIRVPAVLLSQHSLHDSRLEALDLVQGVFQFDWDPHVHLPLEHDVKLVSNVALLDHIGLRRYLLIVQPTANSTQVCLAEL